MPEIPAYPDDYLARKEKPSADYDRGRREALEEALAVVRKADVTDPLGRCAAAVEKLLSQKRDAATERK